MAIKKTIMGKYIFTVKIMSNISISLVIWLILIYGNIDGVNDGDTILNDIYDNLDTDTDI